MTRVAIVTGGASGIGRATVERFIGAGWAVVAADLNAEHAAALGRELGDEQLTVAVGDVAHEPDMEAFIARALDQHGRLDCMVNNAGVGGAFGAVTELDVSDWDYTFAVNVRSVFLGTKHAARAFAIQGNGGCIVNVASIAGAVGGAGPQAYSAAKAAVIHFTHLVAAELASQRIRVNAVCPGIIRTPLMDSARHDIADGLRGIQPWPDVANADDIAKVIEFLASDAAGFITGADLTADGGLVAAGVRLGDSVGGNPALRGLAGVNRGTTGQASTVRRRSTHHDGN